MKIANAVLLMAAVGSANAQFLRTQESTLDCLQHCASVDGRKKLSDIKKRTFKTAIQCSESCTTNRSISECAGTCYKKFANDAQKVVDKEVKKVVDKEVKSCEKKCDDGDDKCKKDCEKKGSKNLSNKDTKKAVSKIGGKVTDKVDTCLATCVHGSEGLDFMDYDFYDYPEDYDYYLEDPEDSEDLDYEDSMDLEDYEDFEDEDPEDFELIAGDQFLRTKESQCEDKCFEKFGEEAEKIFKQAVKKCESECKKEDESEISKCKRGCKKGKGVNERKVLKKVEGKPAATLEECVLACDSEDYDYYLEDPEDSEDFDYEDSMDLEDYEDFEDEDPEDFELIAGAGDEEGEGKGKKSTKKEDEKKDEKDEKEPRKGSKEFCKIKKNKNSRHCDEYYKRGNKHRGRKDDYCYHLNKNECKVAVEKEWCEWYDKHNKSKGCRAFKDDEDFFMAYA